MRINRANIAETAIAGIWWLKFKEFFNRYSKPTSKELIEIQCSDDEIPDFLPPDPNNTREFKTGKEMLQYAKEIGSKLQPKIRPNKNCESNL